MLDSMFISKKRLTTLCKPVLMALGVNDTGDKHVLAVMAVPNESFESWSALLQQLKRDGSNLNRLRMAAFDGCAGMNKALEVALPDAPKQRCTVQTTHRAKEILADHPRLPPRKKPQQSGLRRTKVRGVSVHRCLSERVGQSTHN